MKKNNNHFSSLVKKLRNNKGLTMYNFAILLGYSTSTISHFENGRRFLHIDILDKYIKILCNNKTEKKDLINAWLDYNKNMYVAYQCDTCKSVLYIDDLYTFITNKSINITCCQCQSNQLVNENTFIWMEKNET